MTQQISQAFIHLQQDPIMAQLIATFDPPSHREANEINLFVDVIESIISQQLSVKAADVIQSRFYSLLPQHQITPEAILLLGTEEIRACGVSYAKVAYIKSAADSAVTGLVNFETLSEKSDEDVIAELTKIHGVGKWTAEMLLMFSLHRPDIFSIGDLGLRTAVSRLYGVDRTDLPAIEAIALQWSPYRTTASTYLWKSLDNTPKIG